MLQIDYRVLVGYSIKPGEPVPSAIQRIVAEEISSAADQLDGRGEPDRDEAIHEARKNVKKIRGVLKLVRPELGSLYGTENVRFREIGRKLSSFRDAGAMLEMFDQLSDLCKLEWGAHDMLPVRAKLLEEKAHRESESGIEEVLATVSGELRSALNAVPAWSLKAEGFPALAAGLEATYRDGRRAMRRAIREPVPESFHDWRKRVKDHWYQMRLIGQVCGDALSFYQKNLKHLETCLGDDHNLAVLLAKVAAEPDLYGPRDTIAIFLETIGKRQEKLRSTADSVGKTIYQEKPKAFLKQMKRLWEGWIKDRERINSSLPATG